MKTPHRLIHDAKEAGAITEQEWQAFMLARNEVEGDDWLKGEAFFTSDTASRALDNAFRWSTSGGYKFWDDVFDKLVEYESSKQVAEQ